jgi:hypothetical protein
MLHNLVGKSGKKNRQGVFDIRATQRAIVVVKKPGVDARLVEDVTPLASDVKNRRRRYGF